MDSITFELMKYPIVAVSLLMAVIHVKLAIRYKGQPQALTKWGIAIMGLYWAVYYARSIFGIDIQMHQVFVRSPILVTLSLITAMGILALRRLEK